MNRFTYLARSTTFVVALLCVAEAQSQSGLYLSTPPSAAQYMSRGRISVTGSTQPLSGLSLGGGYVTYCPYFKTSHSELRLTAGYGLHSSKIDYLSDMNYFLIQSEAPGYNIQTGYTKVIQQSSTPTYFEFAVNADVSYRYTSFAQRVTPNTDDGKIRLRMNSFLARGGIEVIPIPKILSFYANINLLLGTMTRDLPTDANLLKPDGSPAELLNKAEYIDAGVRVMTKRKKESHLRASLDASLIFAERRITDRVSYRDSVLPVIKGSLTWLLPKSL